MSIYGNPMMMGGSGGSGIIVPKTITANGVYNASDDNADGYSPVTVNIGGGEIESWDFTSQSPLIGQPRGYALTTNGITYSSAGAVFSGVYSYILIGFPFLCEIELDVVSMSLTSGTHRRFVMGDVSNGLIYRSTGVWAFYNGSWEDTEETDGSFFDGSTVKIAIDGTNHWHIYKDGVLWWEPSGAQPHQSLRIGSENNSINNVTIARLALTLGVQNESE